MLPKKRRISRAEFSDLLSNSKRFNSPSLTFYLSKILNEGGVSKFAFSVSKKVSNKAVVRNKLRRRGYSVIRKYIKQIKPNYYCFFVFKKGADSIKFASLEKEIFELLSNSLVLE